ncbi:hypothetical protein ETB97_001356 [Aspergillus alliaceus]|uniref:Uncharacterized protein n=1 Tax=Petromyces alliaceus TaxID=209559 RepID=A0A8H6E5U2_PETAA|nr:hypothetical protein ETB97_001356 [Aspergillus burnettii]
MSTSNDDGSILERYNLYIFRKSASGSDEWGFIMEPLSYGGPWIENKFIPAREGVTFNMAHSDWVTDSTGGKATYVGVVKNRKALEGSLNEIAPGESIKCSADWAGVALKVIEKDIRLQAVSGVSTTALCPIMNLS